MNALFYIAYFWYKLSSFFWVVADYASYIPGVGSYLRDWFVEIANTFYDGVGDIPPGENCLWSRTIEFRDLIRDILDSIKKILTWDNIKDYITSWLRYLGSPLTWFIYLLGEILAKVNEWWQPVYLTVKQWIEARIAGFDSLKVAWNNFWSVTWPDWMSRLDILKAAWDNFWTVTFPKLVSFDWLGIWWNGKLKELDTLINDKLKAWFPFYDDLVNLWDNIKLFFTDPLEFLWTKFADWFLGPER